MHCNAGRQLSAACQHAVSLLVSMGCAGFHVRRTLCAKIACSAHICAALPWLIAAAAAQAVHRLTRRQPRPPLLLRLPRCQWPEAVTQPELRPSGPTGRSVTVTPAGARRRCAGQAIHCLS